MKGIKPSKRPLVTIVILTKNSAKTLPLVLNSIQKQTLPQNKIEVLIIDGMSKDETRSVAREFNIKVLDNPKIGFIPGKYLGFMKAQGKYLMYLDSDEELENPNSLSIKISAFAFNSHIKAVLSSGYKNPSNYPFINRYINEFGDPFSFFIYKSTKDYRLFLKELIRKYKRDDENKNFTVFDFSSVKPLPLIELVAMACTIDLNFFRSEFPALKTNQNLIPHLFYLLNTRPTLVAITKNDPIIHYSADTFSRYLRKIAWRIRNNIFNKETTGESGFEGRDKFQPRIYQFKRFLFIPYSLSLIFPLIDSLYLFISRKDATFFIHPILCIYTSCLIIYYYLLKLLKVNSALSAYGT